DHEVGVDGPAGGRVRLLVAADALLAGTDHRAGRKEGDALVAQGKEVLERAPDAAAVVDHRGVELVADVAVLDHDRHRAASKHRVGVRIAFAQYGRDDAVHAAALEDAD